MDRKKLQILDNQSKILYVLIELGDLNYIKIVNVTNLSKNTISKYLKQLIVNEYIVKKIVPSDKGRDYIGYGITEKGKQKFQYESFFDRDDNWLASINPKIEELENLRTKGLIIQSIYQEKTTQLGRIEESYFYLLNNTLNILEYGEDLGNINDIIAKLGSMASKFGEKFFEIEPNNFLHLAIIYIFFKSIENPQFHTNSDIFLETYGQIDDNFRNSIKHLRIYRDKILRILEDKKVIDEIELILNKELQTIDKNIKKRFKDALVDIEKSIKKSPRFIIDSKHKVNTISQYRKLYNNYYNEKLRVQNRFQKNIDLVMDGYYGLNVFYLNYEPYFFHDRDSVGVYLNQKIIDTITQQLISKKIFGMQEILPLVDISKEIAKEMVTMHMIWEEIQEKFSDLILKLLLVQATKSGLRKTPENEHILNLNEIKGFCPNCGQKILIDSVNECEFCKSTFSSEEIVYDIKNAKRVAMEYRAIKYVESTSSAFVVKCDKCGNMIGQNWKRCPRCKKVIKK